jgi:hypothetical protein
VTTFYPCRLYDRSPHALFAFGRERKPGARNPIWCVRGKLRGPYAAEPACAWGVREGVVVINGTSIAAEHYPDRDRQASQRRQGQRSRESQRQGEDAERERHLAERNRAITDRRSDSARGTAGRAERHLHETPPLRLLLGIVLGASRKPLRGVLLQG